MVTYRTKTSAQGTWQYLSVHCLLNQRKVVDIPDDLESIFHVLLYFAVRFLPHNIRGEGVGLFLHNYFDDYTTSYSSPTCGDAKYNAVTAGEIDITLLTGGTVVNGRTQKELLSFYMYPPPPANDGLESVAPPPHPIQALLSSLLEYFGDYYSLSELPDRPSTSSATAEASATTCRDLSGTLAGDPDVADVIQASASDTASHAESNPDVSNEKVCTPFLHQKFPKSLQRLQQTLQTIADDCRRDSVDYRSCRPPACRHLQTRCRCLLLTCMIPQILPPASPNQSKASQGPPRRTLQQSPAHSLGSTCRIGLRECDVNGCGSPVFQRDIGGRYVLLNTIHVVS